jgi:heme oxygenase
MQMTTQTKITADTVDLLRSIDLQVAKLRDRVAADPFGRHAARRSIWADELEAKADALAAKLRAYVAMKEGVNQ